ncbi:bifunctional glycosyltransferase/CDP-glycerol:glycerophosphate glycerophosphotransferase [Streptomyces ossamyceticus]|uniref:bifunctional glycosyltransferase/CDP-glycerol:glycerophosphate glycerophosphotransferase n=1 Tax=Streptomyces ossamyceticus TaxID=249581 RepID=UPI0034708160
MPRFTVIVPTHGVEGSLPLALDSVLTQPFGDFEPIPVHDIDDTPAGTVTAAYARRDTRIAPVPSPPAAGLGGARHTGLAAAHGTYALFLDGDDTLVPGALQRIGDRLREAADPDVLYVSHERAHWWEGGTAVVHADGWDVYREARDVCLNLPAAPPGHVTRDEGELADLFRGGSYGDAAAGALRAAFRERFCQFDDGRAAERIARRVFLGEPSQALPPVVPLAERTPAPRPPAPLVRS